MTFIRLAPEFYFLPLRAPSHQLVRVPGPEGSSASVFLHAEQLSALVDLASFRGGLSSLQKTMEQSQLSQDRPLLTLTGGV